MLTLRSLAKVTHHARLYIGGEYFVFGNALGNPHAEISGARADIGDARSGLQIQGVQNLFRLLPASRSGLSNSLAHLFASSNL